MMFPTVHLGGTRPNDLLKDQISAMNALREAIAKLQAAGPNGRDYYPQGNTAIQAALEEHQTRVDKLRNVLAELDSLATHIAKGVR